MEQRAVRQVGQRVVMGEVGDALLGAAALGDVFMGRQPSAVRHRLVDDLDRTSVGRRYHHDVAMRDVAQHHLEVLIDVADERAGFLAVGDHLAEAATRLHDLGREAVHFEIPLVADDEMLRRIEQQQPLRHVVDGGVETLLFQRQPLLATRGADATACGRRETAGRRSPARKVRRSRSALRSARASRPVRPMSWSKRRSTIGKFASARDEISRSLPSIGLVRRVAVLSAVRISAAGRPVRS